MDRIPDRNSTSSGNVLVIAAPLAIVSGLLFNGYDGATGQAVSCILHGGLAALLILALRPGDAFWQRSGPVLLLALAALAWGIFATWRPGYGLPDYAPGHIVAYVGALGALIAGAVLAWHGRSRRRLIDLMTAANTVFVSAGLAMFWLGTDSLFPFWSTARLGRFQGTIGNINVTSVTAACFALWAGYRLLILLRDPHARTSRDVLRKAFFGVALAINLLAVILTASRLTNLMLIAELGIAMLLLCIYRRMPIRQWAIRVVPVTAILAVIAWYFSGRLKERFNSIPDGWSERVGMWSHYSDLAWDQPLFGYGLGSFPMVNAQHLTDPRFAGSAWAVNSPHNVLLQLLLGGGIPYCVLILAAIAVGAVQTLRAIRRQPGDEDIAIVAMIALILGSALIDVVLDMPATIGLTMFLAGLLWGHIPERIEAGVAHPRPHPAIHERPVAA